MKKLLPQSLFIAAALFLFSFHPVWADYTIKQLLTPPQHSNVVDINDKGEIIGGVTNYNPYNQVGFLWKNGQVTYFESDFHVQAINNSEQVVGFTSNNQGDTTSYLLQNGSKTELPILVGFSSCIPSDINDSGEIVGYCGGASPLHPHAVMWQNGQITDLGPGHTQKINSNGEVLGTSIDSSNNEVSVVWQNGTLQDLKIPADQQGQYGCYGNDINDNGDIAGVCGKHAYLWKDTQIIDLGMPTGNDADQTRGGGINNNDQVTFSVRSSVNGNWYPYLWQNGNTEQLPSLPAVNPNGIAYEINNLGFIAGISQDEVDQMDVAVMWSLPAVNTAPIVNNVAANPSTLAIDTSANATGSFTDDAVDSHTAVWDWGDNSTSQGTVTEPNGSTPGSVAGSHTYTTAGVYTVTLTVTDNGGLNGSSTYQYVSVYNPTSQGLFSAGSHFTSPTGAYVQNPSLTGEVKFGLSYKYQGSVPTGDKQFMMNFKDANLTFNATTISSLVISNNMATLRGTGTINGSGNDTFLVTGVDGGGIRIKITDASNAIIYDTQLNAADTATPTTTVTGHVVAHN